MKLTRMSVHCPKAGIVPVRPVSPRCARGRHCQRDGVSAAGLVGADHAVLYKMIWKRRRKSLIGENAIPVEAVVRRENNVITNGDLHVFDARWLAVSARASGTNCHA